MRNILELPTIREREVCKDSRFLREAVVQCTLKKCTLKKLNELDAAARFTFDKLEVIKNELALIDGKWRDWTFKEFLETLEKWTINNPLQGGRKQKAFFKPRGKNAYATWVCVLYKRRTQSRKLHQGY